MACNPASDSNLNLFDCLILDSSKGDTLENTVKGTYSTPAVLVNVIVRNLFVLGGVILFLMIILAGFKFAMSPTNAKEEAKKIATGAGIGFLIMFSAYWIIQILETVTGIGNII